MSTCLTLLACMAAIAPAWAGDPPPLVVLAQADPELAFRTLASETLRQAADERGQVIPMTRSLTARRLGTGESRQPLNGTSVVWHYPPGSQVAQATGTTNPGAATDTDKEEPAPEGPYSGSLWSRSTMTGDWGGFRNTMAAKGITLSSDFTQIAQSMVSGGLDIGWKYQGRGQITLNVDTQKLGLWPGGFLTVQTEGNYGETVNGNAGALIPVNTSAIFPTAG
jgi:hypothetical protein